MPHDGKRKKAVVQQTYPRAHFEPAAFEKIKAAGSFCLSERFIVRMQKRSTVYGSSGSAFTTTAWAPSRFQAHFLYRHPMYR